MTGVVALFGAGIAAFAGLSLLAPLDADEEDGDQERLRQAALQTLGASSIDGLAEGVKTQEPPRTIEDFWPVLRSDGLHRWNFAPGKQKRGYTSMRWPTHQPNARARAKEDVGQMPPGMRQSQGLVDAQQQRQAFVLSESEPWMMQPGAYDRRIPGPTAYRYAQFVR